MRKIGINTITIILFLVAILCAISCTNKAKDTAIITDTNININVKGEIDYLVTNVGNLGQDSIKFDIMTMVDNDSTVAIRGEGFNGILTGTKIKELLNNQ